MPGIPNPRTIDFDNVNAKTEAETLLKTTDRLQKAVESTITPEQMVFLKEVITAAHQKQQASNGTMNKVDAFHSAWSEKESQLNGLGLLGWPLGLLSSIFDGRVPLRDDSRWKRLFKIACEVINNILSVEHPQKTHSECSRRSLQLLANDMGNITVPNIQFNEALNMIQYLKEEATRLDQPAASRTIGHRFHPYTHKTMSGPLYGA